MQLLVPLTPEFHSPDPVYRCELRVWRLSPENDLLARRGSRTAARTRWLKPLKLILL
jgi:hypothetical protein